MRVDAARNRDRIVAAARDLVAREGAEVRMDALAREAGVAVGTLYRHFPTKDDLVAAVVEQSVLGIAERTEAALDQVRAGADPGEAVAVLFREIAAAHARDQAVKQAASALGLAVHLDTTGAPEGSALARAGSALSSLLDAARSAGRIDASVTPQDLAVLIGQVPTDAGEQARERYVEIVLAGLRATPPTGR